MMPEDVYVPLRHGGSLWKCFWNGNTLKWIWGFFFFFYLSWDWEFQCCWFFKHPSVFVLFFLVCLLLLLSLPLTPNNFGQNCSFLALFGGINHMSNRSKVWVRTSWSGLLGWRLVWETVTIDSPFIQGHSLPVNREFIGESVDDQEGWSDLHLTANLANRSRRKEQIPVISCPGSFPFVALIYPPA